MYAFQKLISSRFINQTYPVFRRISAFGNRFQNSHSTTTLLLTNVLTKYQLPTPYGIQDIARTRFYRSRSLRQGQRSNHDIAHLHSLTNVPTKYQLPTPYGFRDIAHKIL